MSKKKHVRFRGDWFWAFDVELGVFLKHLIDAAMPITAHGDADCLSKAIDKWKVVAVVADLGIEIDASWSASQLATFVAAAEMALDVLKQREEIPADEIGQWDVLDGEGPYTRGLPVVMTKPVIEVGQAIIDLVRGTLPQAPEGTVWFLGTSQGWRTIEVSDKYLVGSSRVDLQACKLEYSIVSPK